MDKKDIDKTIQGFFVTEKDFEKNLYLRIEYYHLMGFRVKKPATDNSDIIYPKGKHRKEDIDREILMLCHWILKIKNNG